MTLKEIMEKSGEKLGLEIQIALNLSVKHGLMDVQWEINDLSQKLEKIGICTEKVFYEAFHNAHSQNLNF